MADQIKNILDVDNPQRFSLVLGGRRYQLVLWWNDRCEYWTFQIFLNGTLVYGARPLVSGQIVANAVAGLPWSFGGLYLETLNDEVTGRSALPSGSQRLWFLHSGEIFARYGTTRII